MKIKHLILTRYALKSGGDLNVTLDKDWFARRLELFEVTLASVKAQTVKDFEWLLFFSGDFFEEMKAVAALLRKSLMAKKARAPMICEGDFENFNTEMVKHMAHNIGPEITHVLSTRLDSDDEIAPDFVEILQRQAAIEAVKGDTGPVFLNFSLGRNLENGVYVPHYHPSNMFLSVLEPAGDYRGIFTWAHNSVRLVGRVVQIPERDKWTHIMHGSNVWPTERREI